MQSLFHVFLKGKNNIVSTSRFTARISGREKNVYLETHMTKSSVVVLHTLLAQTPLAHRWTNGRQSSFLGGRNQAFHFHRNFELTFSWRPSPDSGSVSNR